MFLGTLDTSNYPESHPLYSNQFEAALFKFKSEVGCHEILAGVFLKAKVGFFFKKNVFYSYVYLL